jgi:Na+-translocating membrane potential-generating system (MpsC)
MSLEPDQESETGGALAAAISTNFVQLLKEHADRSPTKCRTYIDDDLIIVLMRGGYSRPRAHCSRRSCSTATLTRRAPQSVQDLAGCAPTFRFSDLAGMKAVQDLCMEAQQRKIR